ncbi:MAG: hypothetical protein ACTSSH_00985 [Candidatus Heimdallarchaeota archaeon]
MLELKKTDEWAFFFLFIGGITLTVNTIIGSIIFAVRGQLMIFLDGFGLFSLYHPVFDTAKHYAGTAVNIVFGLVALMFGLKLFIKPFYAFISKIDLAIVGLIGIFIGLASCTLPGLLLVVGGIYCFIYRLTLEGAQNPKAA